jgi:hypothetical protein
MNTYNDFLATVSIYYEKQAQAGGDLRYGQMYMNHLWEIKPRIAEKLNGSLLDPFYRDNCPPKVHEFVEAIWFSE